MKKLYKHAGKCDNQQQFKDILEAAMIPTPEGFTNNRPRYPMTPIPIKKPSTIKSLCVFTNILDVKDKTAISQVGAAKLKYKSIKAGTSPWELKQKLKRNSKINDYHEESFVAYPDSSLFHFCDDYQYP